MFPSPHMQGVIALMSLIGFASPTTAAAAGAGGAWLDSLLGNEVLALLVVITSGLLLGRIRVAGISLGSSGVIFTALALGYLGYGIPDAVGTLGLVVFAYCVGLTAGPNFFRLFRRHGKSLALVSVALVAIGAITAGVLSVALGIPADLSAGIFAGALTSTPGLAAAMEWLPPESQIAVGYGIAYPFGVVAVVLFVQFLPRLLRVDLGELSRTLARREQRQQDRRIDRVLVEVCNPAVIGRKLADIHTISESNCQVARILEGDRLVPVPAGLTLAEGQRLLLVARAFRLPPLVDLLGVRDDRAGLLMDTEGQRMHVVVSSREMIGKGLDDLRLRSRFGVTVTRITRHELEFVPKGTDDIQFGDMLTVVGEHEHLEAFAGHRSRSFNETDLISLGIGIVAGVLLGMVRIGLGDGDFALGMVGGPLCVGLLLAHFDHIGPIKGHLPAASRLLMTEVGLVLFLASAGAGAGGELADVLRTQGPRLCLAACCVALSPMVFGSLLAWLVFRMNLLQLLGAVCGGMTSTPGLGALMAKTDSEAPVVAYTGAYPVALIVITVFAKVMVRLLA